MPCLVCLLLYSMSLRWNKWSHKFHYRATRNPVSWKLPHKLQRKMVIYLEFYWAPSSHNQFSFSNFLLANLFPPVLQLSWPPILLLQQQHMSPSNLRLEWERNMKIYICFSSEMLTTFFQFQSLFACLCLIQLEPLSLVHHHWIGILREM